MYGSVTSTILFEGCFCCAAIMTEYLTKRGIPPNLPQLDIIYEGLGQVEPSRKFSQSKDRLLQKVPIVTCPAVEGEMYCTLLIDPDAPSPAGDPAEPGKVRSTSSL